MFFRKRLRKTNTKEKANLKNGILNDLLILMVNKPFVIYLFGFCLKDLKLKL